MTRSVFSTNTGKSALVATIAGLVVLIVPFVGNIAKRHSSHPEDVEDIVQIVLVIAGILSTSGGGLAIVNRARATDKVYLFDKTKSDSENNTELK